MKIMMPAILAIVACLGGSTAWAQTRPELKIAKIEIVPNSVVDMKGPFFRDRPMLQVAPALEGDDEKLTLPRYRSYRFIVTIKVSGRTASESLRITTECIRGHEAVVLGKARIGLTNRGAYYACYDVFPGEAGPGDCTIRTLVEASGQTINLEFPATIP